LVVTGHYAFGKSFLLAFSAPFPPGRKGSSVIRAFQ